jgi:hypothetical protein
MMRGGDTKRTNEMRNNAFAEFQSETLELLGGRCKNTGDRRPVFWAALFKTVKDTDDFTFGTPDRKGGCDLIMGAIMLATQTNIRVRVVFLCPSIRYGIKAQTFVTGWTRMETLPNLEICPAAWVTAEMIKNTDVFLHHGKDNRSIMPPSTKARHVIQNFGLENLK